MTFNMSFKNKITKKSYSLPKSSPMVRETRVQSQAELYQILKNGT